MAISAVKPAEYTTIQSAVATYLQSNGYFRSAVVTVGNVMTRNQHTVYRDKDRFKFQALAHYPPQYPYDVQIWDQSSQSQVPLTTLSYQVNSGGTLITFSVATSKGIDSNWNGSQDVASASYDTYVASARAQIVADLNGQVKSEYVSAGETLIESGKSARMINSTVSRLVKSIRAVRRGNFSDAAKLLGLTHVPKGTKVYVKGRGWVTTPPGGMSIRAFNNLKKNGAIDVGKTSKVMAENWLAYRYGWTPLYLTVYGEMKRQYDHGKTIVNPVRRVSCAPRSFDLPFIVNTSGRYTTCETGNALSGIDLRHKEEKRRSVTVKQVWYFKIENPYYARNTELGLTNPASLAWELLPLSFCVDWIINVGDVLDQMDTWLGKQFLTGCETIVRRCEVKRYHVNFGFIAPYVGKSFNTCTWRQTGMRVTRTVLTNPPSVALQIRNAMNLKRSVDAISLLRAFK